MLSLFTQGLEYVQGQLEGRSFGSCTVSCCWEFDLSLFRGRTLSGWTMGRSAETRGHGLRMTFSKTRRPAKWCEWWRRLLHIFEQVTLHSCLRVLWTFFLVLCSTLRCAGRRSPRPGFGPDERSLAKSCIFSGRWMLLANNVMNTYGLIIFSTSLNGQPRANTGRPCSWRAVTSNCLSKDLVAVTLCRRPGPWRMQAVIRRWKLLSSKSPK